LLSVRKPTRNTAVNVDSFRTWFPYGNLQAIQQLMWTVSGLAFRMETYKQYSS
jgi:hypothetical protein